MRLPHAVSELCPVARRPKSLHLSLVVNRTGSAQMFVRAVWRDKRLVDIKRSLREMDVPTSRDTVLFGNPKKDFHRMTKGLFDR
jgi:hypothetical protein